MLKQLTTYYCENEPNDTELLQACTLAETLDQTVLIFYNSCNLLEVLVVNSGDEVYDLKKKLNQKLLREPEHLSFKPPTF